MKVFLWSVARYIIKRLRKKSRKLQEKRKWCFQRSATVTFFHYFTLCLLGLLLWAMAWFAMGDNWRWDGPWFRIAAVGVVAWASGLLLQATTSLPPLLAALLTGIIARQTNILDMRQYSDIDSFLRKIYPCLILGKNSLGWNLSYMKKNRKRVAALGLLPWSAEVLAMTICSNFMYGFPWAWGIFLGSVYASLTVPVVMPILLKLGPRPKVHWPLLVGSAGGIDLFLSVGVNGVMYSYIFCEVSDTYKYVKVVLSLLVGVVLGLIWGWCCGHVPHPANTYVKEMRILLVLFGGILGSFVGDHFEWKGTAAVAVLICNATAAHFWKKHGWELNNNPASTAYRVMWATVEPLVFAYTGTYFVTDKATLTKWLYDITAVMICLTIRLCAVLIACCGMTLKEKVFTCFVWTPKAIVEAVLSPLPIITLLKVKGSKSEKDYAEDVIRVIVEAILFTTLLGFLLTLGLGPRVLKEEVKIVPESHPKEVHVKQPEQPEQPEPAFRPRRKRKVRKKPNTYPRARFQPTPQLKSKPRTKYK